MDKLQRYEIYDKRIGEDTVCLDGDVSALEAEIDLLKKAIQFDRAGDAEDWRDGHPIFVMAKDIDNLEAENEKLKSEMIAPTDSGIVRFDSICEEFNSGKRDLISLCCALWNSGTVAGRTEKS